MSRPLNALAAALAFAVTPALAGTGYSAVHMTLEGPEVPMIEISAGTEVSTSSQTDGALVEVLLGFEYGGIEGKEEGQYWARVFAEGGIDPTTGRVTSFRVEFTPYHSVGASDPLPVAWDTRLFNFVASRDEVMGRELDATIKVLGWTGGFYLPATDPGDFEIMVVIAAEALGGRIRQYAQEDLATHYGGYIGGISVEAAFGKKLSQDFTITGHLGGGGEWSIGGNSNGLSLISDTEVFANLVLNYRDLLEFIVGGSYEFTRDSGQREDGDGRFEVDALKVLASLRLRF